MMDTSTILPIVAVLSISSSFFQSIGKAVEVAAPPPISGTAETVDPVRAGEVVLIDWTIEKRVDCPGWSARVWRGQDNFYLAERSRPTELPAAASAYVRRIQTQIPILIPTGDASLSIVGEYTCAGSEPLAFEIGPIDLVVVE